MDDKPLVGIVFLSIEDLLCCMYSISSREFGKKYDDRQ